MTIINGNDNGEEYVDEYVVASIPPTADEDGLPATKGQDHLRGLDQPPVPGHLGAHVVDMAGHGADRWLVPTMGLCVPSTQSQLRLRPEHGGGLGQHPLLRPVRQLLSLLLPGQCSTQPQSLQRAAESDQHPTYHRVQSIDVRLDREWRTAGLQIEIPKEYLPPSVSLAIERPGAAIS